MLVSLDCLKAAQCGGELFLCTHAAGLCVKFLEGSITTTVSLMLQVSISLRLRVLGKGGRTQSCGSDS